VANNQTPDTASKVTSWRVTRPRNHHSLHAQGLQKDRELRAAARWALQYNERVLPLPMLLHSKRFHQWASRNLSGQALPGQLLTAMQQQLQEDPAGVQEKLAAAGGLAQQAYLNCLRPVVCAAVHVQLCVISRLSVSLHMCRVAVAHLHTQCSNCPCSPS
jgi:hypothetical protein